MEKYGVNWPQLRLRLLEFHNFRETGGFALREGFQRLEYSPEACKGAFEGLFPGKDSLWGMGENEKESEYASLL